MSCDQSNSVAAYRQRQGFGCSTRNSELAKVSMKLLEFRSLLVVLQNATEGNKKLELKTLRTNAVLLIYRFIMQRQLMAYQKEKVTP